MKQIKYLIFTLILISFACGKQAEKVIVPVEEELKLTNDLKHFLFVANSGKKNSLYKYDFEKDTAKLFWFSERESVVNLSYSPNKKNAFFITATTYGKRGVFPFIRFIKVYHYDYETNTITKIKNLKHGVQLVTVWNNDQLFEITLNSIDSTVANYIIQTKTLFSANGKEVAQTKKIFDLLTDGYPPLPKQGFILSSPNEKYFFEVNEEKIARVRKNGERWEEIFSLAKPLSDIAWSNNDRYLIFSTLDVSPSNETLYDAEPNTSELYVYDCEENKMIMKNLGSGFRNFLLLGNLLIFDKNFANKAVIIIYDLNERTEKSITTKNGCGIKYFPEVPDYDA